jgi:hypothetical protein
MRRVLAMLMVGAAAQVVAARWFRHSRQAHAGSRPHVLVVQGGAQRRLAGDELADAVVSVLMGGVVLDLRETALLTRPARLDVLCVMGGVDLVVPEDWKVQVDVSVLMGGVHDGRTGPIDAERPPDLVVSGHVVMGGIDVSHEMPADLYEHLTRATRAAPLART